MPQHLPAVDELALELGEQLRMQRIRMRVTQDELAAAAGLTRKVIVRLENGAGATVHSLLAVVRALGRVDWIRGLAPAVAISPMELLRSQKPPLRRVRARKNEKLRVRPFPASSTATT
jgi:DNA-binding XRE family transcriptional regulator